MNAFKAATMVIVSSSLGISILAPLSARAAGSGRTGASLACAALFNTVVAPNRVSMISLNRGYMDTMKRFDDVLPNVRNVDLSDPTIAREQGARVAQWIETEAGKKESVFFRLLYRVLSDTETVYSRDWFESFLREMYLASYALEIDSDNRPKNQLLYRNLLREGFRIAMMREKSATRGRGTQPVSLYSRQVWQLDRESGRAEILLRRDGKKAEAKVFAKEKMAVKAGHQLAQNINESALSPQVHLRLSSLILQHVHVGSPAGFFKGFFDESLVTAFKSVDEESQEIFLRSLKVAEKNNGVSLSLFTPGPELQPYNPDYAKVFLKTTAAKLKADLLPTDLIARAALREKILADAVKFRVLENQINVLRQIFLENDPDKIRDRVDNSGWLED